MNSNVSPYMLLHSEIHDHDTRNRNKLILPIAQKSHTQAAFLFQGIVEWNALPEEIKCTNSTRLLRKKLRKRYLANY